LHRIFPDCETVLEALEEGMIFMKNIIFDSQQWCINPCLTISEGLWQGWIVPLNTQIWIALYYCTAWYKYCVRSQESVTFEYKLNCCIKANNLLREIGETEIWRIYLRKYLRQSVFVWCLTYGSPVCFNVVASCYYIYIYCLTRIKRTNKPGCDIDLIMILLQGLDSLKLLIQKQCLAILYHV
jgi:hypothetical protein